MQNPIFEMSDECEEKKQTHVHEFEGSVKIAEKEEDPHNHRFAGVSSEAICVPGGHIHKIVTKTDFYENHFHEICIETGLQIPTCNGRHVHFAKGTTTFNDGHKHDFQVATLIDNPIGD
jgi:hypothetical protein